MHKKSVVPSDWEVYTNPDIGFSIKYDPDLKISQRAKQDISLYMYGPTQKGETEMYDGLTLSFRRAQFTGSIDDYVQKEMGQFSAIGQITTPLHDITINNTPAKSFSASGVGDYTVIFVPLDDTSVIEVAYIDPDPGSLGFQKDIDLMLSTFELK